MTYPRSETELAAAMALVGSVAGVRGNPGTPRAPRLRARALGRRLREFARSDEAAAIAGTVRFPVTGRSIVSYTHGGCFIFAEALGQWAGPAAELLAWTVFDEHGAHKEIDHVVTRIGRYYFDAGGAWTEAEARARFEETMTMGGWLAPFGAARAQRSGVGCDPTALRRLLPAMREALGDPAQWGHPRRRRSWRMVPCDRRHPTARRTGAAPSTGD
jgi:hypothetical protein